MIDGAVVSTWRDAFSAYEFLKPKLQGVFHFLFVLVGIGTEVVFRFKVIS